MAQSLLANPGADCIVATDAVLAAYDFSHGFGTLLGILLAYLVVLHLLTYAALLRAGARSEAR